MRLDAGALVSTPWGLADTVRFVAPGIVEVTTPSHGGIIVDDRVWLSLLDAVPALADGLFAGPRCFEEDCDAALLVLLRPALFPDYRFAFALRSLRQHASAAGQAVLRHVESHEPEAVARADAYLAACPDAAVA